MPGTTDLHIQQPFNEPRLFVDVDRSRAQDVGFSQRDIATSLLVALSGSFQTAPTFWLNPKNGVSYNIATQIAAVRSQLAAAVAEHPDHLHQRYDRDDAVECKQRSCEHLAGTAADGRKADPDPGQHRRHYPG